MPYSLGRYLISHIKLQPGMQDSYPEKDNRTHLKKLPHIKHLLESFTYRLSELKILLFALSQALIVDLVEEIMRGTAEVKNNYNVGVDKMLICLKKANSYGSYYQKLNILQESWSCCWRESCHNKISSDKYEWPGRPDTARAVGQRTCPSDGLTNTVKMYYR